MVATEAFIPSPGNTVDLESDAGSFNASQDLATALAQQQINRPQLANSEIVDCEECGRRIAEARRKALSGVRTCITCARAAE